MKFLRDRLSLAVGVVGLAVGCSSGSATNPDGGSDAPGSAGRSGNAGASGTGGQVGAGGFTGGMSGTTGTAGASGQVGGGGSGGNGAAGAIAATGGRGGSAGSGSATGGAAGGAGVGGRAGGAGGNGQGGPGGGSASGGSSVGGGSGSRLGIIIVSQTEQTFPPPIGRIVASGAAATFGSVAGTNTCQTTTVGECMAYECAPTSGNTSQSPPLLQAGNVTVTGLALDVPLVFGATAGTYISASYGSALWTSSRPAMVVVTGSADVPAFTLGVTAPNPISVTAPSAQSNSTYTISRGSALAVAWTGGVEGKVTVNVTSGTAATGQVTIACYVDAANGAVTVPAAFMSRLGASGGFSAGVSNIATRTIGDWMMQFQAQTLKDQGAATFTN